MNRQFRLLLMIIPVLVILIIGVWGAFLSLPSSDSDSASDLPTLAVLPDDPVALEHSPDDQSETIEASANGENVPVEHLDNAPIDDSINDTSILLKSVPDQYILHLANDITPTERENYLNSINATVVQDLETLNVIVIRTDQNPLEATSPVIVEAEPDYYASALLAYPPTDPYLSEQWNLDMVDATTHWNAMPETLAPVTVTVIDSGVCLDHPDLQGVYTPFRRDYVDDDDIPQDVLGHGCAVAGIIASQNNAVGVIGIAPFTKIMPLRVLDNRGYGLYSDIAASIVEATNQGADIINLSLGGNSPSTVLQSAVNYALDRGVILVAAGGNSAGVSPLYPAAYNGVISVGSVDSNGQASPLNHGGLDLLAPGTNVISTHINNDYAWFSGSSFAAPHVAGIAAIQLASGQVFSADEPIISVDVIQTDPLPTSDSNKGVPENAILIGDILIPKDQYDEASGLFTFNAVPWTNGIIPYVFNANVNTTQRAQAREAMDQWEDVANVTFVPRSSQANYISIRDSSDDTNPGNNSFVGMLGIGAQVVNIVDWNFKYVIVHEFGHALGLWHEQSAPDRDTYVQINFDNMEDGDEAQFFKLSSAYTFGDYDFASVMHYFQYAFSNNGLPTISVKSPNTTRWQSRIGMIDQLSELDGLGMLTVYPCDPDDPTDMSCQNIPRNDYIDEAVIIDSRNFSHTITEGYGTQHTSGSIDDPQPGCVPNTGKSVWYALEVETFNYDVTISTAGSDYDTVLSVWKPGVPGTWSSVACSDDFNATPQSQVTFSAYPDTVYYIMVSGYAFLGSEPSSGNLTLNANLTPGCIAQLVDCAAQGIFVPNLTSDGTPGACNTAGCTLREAIIAANNYGDGAIVPIPAGTYTLTRAGTGENASNIGDLDITANIHIWGEDRATTIINANGLDRVFDVFSPAKIEALTITGGNVINGEDGGGIRTNLEPGPLPDAFLHMFDLAIYNNTASGNGGGIGSTSPNYFHTLLSSDVYQNSALNGGGVSLDDDSYMIIRETSIHDNSASGNGGGIYYDSNGMWEPLEQSLIANNSAENGGGIYVADGEYRINASTISANKANNNGGGIFAGDNSFVSFYSTISNNIADFDNNSTGDGGGLFVNSGTVVSGSAIIYGNQDQSGESPDCYTGINGRISTSSYNIIGTLAGCDTVVLEYDDPYVLERDFIGYDPQLQPLADNGGNTFTHALSPSSIAIDNGGVLACTSDGYWVDQRGQLRELLHQCDIGAFEYADGSIDLPFIMTSGNLIQSSFYPEVVANNDLSQSFGGSPTAHLSNIGGDIVVLQFSTLLYNPYGNNRLGDATDLSNYKVLASGSNQVLETTSCDTVSGDDIAISIDDITVNTPYAEVLLFINGGTNLSEGDYRFLACGLKSATGDDLEFEGTNIAHIDYRVADTDTITVRLNYFFDESGIGLPRLPFRTEFDYSIEHFNIETSAPPYDPAGDSDLNDITNPNNYLVVEDGADDTFQTDTCTVQGDDQAVPKSGLTYLTDYEIWRFIPDTPLLNGVYRVIVCNLETASNEPYDGDYDGIPGGNHIVEFELFAKPTTITATVITGETHLSWDDLNISETGYVITRRISPTWKWSEVAITSPNATSFVDSTIQCGNNYHYYIQAERSTDFLRTSREESVLVEYTCEPLVAPDNLNAVTAPPAQNDLTWNDNDISETEYRIERRITGESDFVEIGSAPANSTNYSDTSAICETDYDYRVRAYRLTDNGFSEYSNTTSISTIDCPPDPPGSLIASPIIGSNDIELNWTDNSDSETEFRIQRSISSTSGFAEVGTVESDIETFTDTDVILDCYTAYFYRVMAFRSGDGQASQFSNIASTTTSCDILSAPSDLIISGSTDNIQLAWTDNSPDETSFEIQRAISGTGSFSVIDSVVANSTTYVDITTVCGSEYDYQVRAYRDGDTNYSEFTNIASVTQFCLPPPAPSNLVAMVDPLTTDVTLTWNDNADSETNFYIEQSPNGVDSWTQIDTLGENVITYDDDDLACYTTYYYRVLAHRSDDNVNSSGSNIASVTTWCDPQEIPFLPFTDSDVTHNGSTISGLPTPSCAPNVTQVNFWEYTPIFNRQVNLNTFGSGFDTVISIWTYNGTFTQVGCNDNGTVDGTSATLIFLQKGVRYIIMIGGKNHASGSISFASNHAIEPTYTPSPTQAPVPTSTPVPNLTTVGLYANGYWYFRDSNSTGSTDLTVVFGGVSAGWQPIVGDWNGDGIDGIGLYKDGEWMLRDVVTDRNTVDHIFFFGATETGWQPIAGDWNGDGIDGIGLYKDGQWLLKNNASAGNPDHRFIFNPSQNNSAIPLAGDWFDESRDRVGVYHNGTWYLHNSFMTAQTSLRFIYGPVDGTWKPIVGDWDQDGDDTIGVYKDGAWRLRNTNRAGNVDLGFFFVVNNSTPVTGYRGGAGGLGALVLASDKPISTPLPVASPTTDISISTDIPSATPVPTESPTSTPTITLLPTSTPSATPTWTPSAPPTETLIPPEIPQNTSGT